MADLRRDRRFRIRLPATLQRGKVAIPIQTEDVSKRGLYIRTDNPPALRSLVDLRIALPPDSQELRLHAMVVHVQKPGKAGKYGAGAGLEIYGLKGNERDVWDKFVLHLRRSMTELTGDGAPAPKTSPRYAAELVVRMATVEELMDLVTEDAKHAGLFVRTTANAASGAMVRLHFAHPDSDGSTFPIDAMVRRRVPPPGAAGIGVEFVHFDQARRNELLEFIKEHLHIDLDDDDVIDEAN